MSRRERTESAKVGNVFQFTLVGLVIFSLALIAAASFIGYKLAAINRPKPSDFFMVNPNDKSRSVHDGPWGALMERNIQLERPVEYLTEEVLTSPQPETWTFNGLKRGRGESAAGQKRPDRRAGRRRLRAGNVREEKSGTVLTPSADFLLSLDAATRGKLYLALAGLGVNLYLDYPFIFPGGSIESIYADTRLNPDDVALLKRLVYANGDATAIVGLPALAVPDSDGRTPRGHGAGALAAIRRVRRAASSSRTRTLTKSPPTGATSRTSASPTSAR